MEETILPQEKKIVRVAKYRRCSTMKQELILQEESLNKFLARYKEDHKEIELIINNYLDEGVSGKNLERPAFTRLLDDVGKKKIDLVIFTKLDRLSRSLQDLLNTVTIFQNNGVNFIVVEQSIDTSTSQGRLLFHILGAFAEFERSIIRERMEAGRKKAELSGSRSGKPCNRPKSKIDEDGVEFKFKNHVSMNQIAKQYNVSITPIRRILQERGLA